MFFTSWASLGLTVGSGCSLMAARWQVFSLLSALMAHQLTLEGCTHWWLWCPHLLMWQEIFIFIGMLSLGCFPYSCTLWDSWYPGENGFRRDPAPLLSIPRDPQPMPASEASQGDLSGCCIQTSRPYQFMLILLMLDLRISDRNFFWFLENRLSGNQSHVR